METWEAIRSRKNVRVYDHREIGEPELTQILEAARRTPSASNKQRWDFLVVREKDRLQRLAELWRGARHIPGSAATIALVGPDSDDPSERLSIAYDLGQVTMSVMIAAADLGIGSAHSSAHEVELGREILELPEGIRCWWMIGLGYPADHPLKPIENLDRRPFDEVVHYETW